VQADLAQLVAHRTCNAGVRGSSPLVGPDFAHLIWPFKSDETKSAVTM